MKKYLITLAMLLTLGQTTTVTAQNSKKTQPTELVDSTSQDAYEVYSDTTSTADDSTVVSSSHRIGGSAVDDISMGGLLDHIGMEGLAGMAFVLLVLLIIFVLSPVGIILVILYFLNKNRKDRMRLAQMAMQNGQAIPNQLLDEPSRSEKDTYQTGLRQLFLGIGLMVFLGYTAGKIGFGIGALVFFIGLGKVVIAKTSRNNSRDLNNQNDSINPLNM